ncbi:MAG: FAD-dependent oxidoreductase [Bryobacterales bacterium]|nr:FAD-dependent oxidoreductase [Bryobacterales bacterium]
MSASLQHRAGLPPAVSPASVVVVGAGPAGMQAAWAAASSGTKVTLIDANPSLGGQIWRGEQSNSSVGARLFEKIRKSNIRFLSGCQVVDAPRPGTLLCSANGEPEWISYDRMVIATGARERFLPFPGWTLPNVYGAGGLQAMVRGGLDLRAKRVVVCGSGPLLLSAAATLREHGAEIPLIAEQAPFVHVLRFAWAFRHLPSRVLEAIGLGKRLFGAGYRSGCYPVRAQGVDRVQSVTLRNSTQEWSVRCDYLACSFGLVPNLELPLLLGCRIDAGFVAVDDWQETSVPGVYCAGEVAGIGGMDQALAEGEIAGLAASHAKADPGLRERASPRFQERERCRRFASALAACFALRPELRSIAAPETIVCRCEDIRMNQIDGHTSWREAQLQTYLGMGHCQGRVCGAATGFLLGWPAEPTGPPLFSVTENFMACAKGTGEAAPAPAGNPSKQ